MQEKSFTVLSIYLGIVTVGSLCGRAFKGGSALHDMCPPDAIPHLNDHGYGSLAMSSLRLYSITLTSTHALDSHLCLALLLWKVN